MKNYQKIMIPMIVINGSNYVQDERPTMMQQFPTGMKDVQKGLQLFLSYIRMANQGHFGKW